MARLPSFVLAGWLSRVPPNATLQLCNVGLSRPIKQPSFLSISPPLFSPLIHKLFANGLKASHILLNPRSFRSITSKLSVMSPSIATSSTHGKAEPVGKFLAETVDGGVEYMEGLASFWLRVVDKFCSEPTADSDSAEDAHAPRQNPWSKKWHKKFFESLLLLTNSEYDRANITHDQYLLSLYRVMDTVVANTIHVGVDTEIWTDPLWLTGRVSPGQTRKKMEANEAEIKKLDNLEERSLTESWYFQCLEGSNTYDISKVRKYAEHLAILWDEIHGLWTEDDGLARETHPEAYKKFAIRARRAWTSIRLAEEKWNIMFYDIPDEDAQERDELRDFSNGTDVEQSKYWIDLLTGHMELLDSADSKFDFEWTAK